MHLGDASQRPQATTHVLANRSLPEDLLTHASQATNLRLKICLKHSSVVIHGEDWARLTIVNLRQGLVKRWLMWVCCALRNFRKPQADGTRPPPFAEQNVDEAEGGNLPQTFSGRLAML